MAPNDSQKIGYHDLIRYFHEGNKPPSELRIGGEFELFGVDAKSCRAVPYEGEQGIRLILERMLEDPRWSPLCEEQQLVCLLGSDGSNITIEPGAQVELSGAPRKNLREVSQELDGFLDQLKAVSHDLGIDFIGIGMHPISRQGEIPFVNKCRYEIMAPYLKEKGELAHHMMKETATVQVNLDYTDEQDAMEKLRVAMGITSIVSAMFSNSPLSGGKPNGFMTRREHVWLHTDPDRCGLLPFVFKEGVSFQDYLHYSLNIPMMFVVREGHWIPMHGVRFIDYLEKGHSGLHATQEDWDLHQSTLFPEVRLKQYIEIRGADAQPPGLVMTVPSLWVGILYDREARQAAWEIVRDWSMEERFALQREICLKGLHAAVRGKPILGLARELLRIAREGLQQQGEDLRFLEPLEELILRKGKTPADLLLEKWEKSHHDITNLIRYTSYLQQKPSQAAGL